MQQQNNQDPQNQIMFNWPFQYGHLTLESILQIQQELKKGNNSNLQIQRSNYPDISPEELRLIIYNLKIRQNQAPKTSDELYYLQLDTELSKYMQFYETCKSQSKNQAPIPQNAQQGQSFLSQITNQQLPQQQQVTQQGFINQIGFQAQNANFQQQQLNKNQNLLGMALNQTTATPSVQLPSQAQPVNQSINQQGINLFGQGLNQSSTQTTQQPSFLQTLTQNQLNQQPQSANQILSSQSSQGISNSLKTPSNQPQQNQMFQQQNKQDFGNSQQGDMSSQQDKQISFLDRIKSQNKTIGQANNQQEQSTPEAVENYTPEEKITEEEKKKYREMKLGGVPVFPPSYSLCFQKQQ